MGPSIKDVRIFWPFLIPPSPPYRNFDPYLPNFYLLISCNTEFETLLKYSDVFYGWPLCTMYGVGGAVVHIRRIYNSIILTANTTVDFFFFEKQKLRLNYFFIKRFHLLFVVLIFHRKISIQDKGVLRWEMAHNFEKNSHDFLDVKFDWEKFSKFCGLPQSIWTLKANFLPMNTLFFFKILAFSI